MSLSQKNLALLNNFVFKNMLLKEAEKIQFFKIAKFEFI